MSVIIRGKNPRKPYTVRYWVEGHTHGAKCKPGCAKTQTQREKSFALLKGNTGAEAFKAKVEYDTRAQIFVDDKLGRENFGDAAEAWISRLAVSERSKQTYRSTNNQHVKPALGARSVAQVANARDDVLDLLTVTMAGSGISVRTRARMIVIGTIEEAVRAQKITRHALAGIDLYDAGRKSDRDDFVFPSHAQVAAVAEEVGIAVWLMRGCGLRVEEALAVHKEDFIHGGRTLRVSGQASRDGRDKVALKHRKRGEYRDAPVPAWLWAMVKDMPEGPLSPGNSRPYRVYGTVFALFQRASQRAGIAAGFKPHSLRHGYVSALLGRGVPLTDIAPWVGHRDISKLYKVYGHLLPKAEDRALAALSADWAEWKAA